MDWANFELDVDPKAPVSSTLKSAVSKSKTLWGDALDVADNTVAKLLTKKKKPKNSEEKPIETKSTTAATSELEDTWAFSPAKEARAFVEAQLKPFKEYNDMYKLVTNQRHSTDSTNTLYDKLMKKEKNVLNIVNRLIEDRQNTMQFDDSFLGTPLSRVPLQLIKSINGIMEDIATTSPKTPEEWRAIFVKEKRLVYIGVLLIVVSVFLLFILSSEQQHE
jgi:hypothetical protein